MIYFVAETSCQYHSTNAPYSLIHLALILHYVSNCQVYFTFMNCHAYRNIHQGFMCNMHICGYILFWIPLLWGEILWCTAKCFDKLECATCNKRMWNTHRDSCLLICIQLHTYSHILERQQLSQTSFPVQTMYIFLDLVSKENETPLSCFQLQPRL